MIFVPSKKLLQVMQRYHEESFFLNYDNLDVLTLCLKLHPNLSMSVINGAPLTLIFRNPSIEPNNITLYIHDIPSNPFYITKNFSGDEGAESKIFPGLANFVEYFQSNTKLCVAIFDETLKNVLSEYVDVKLPFQSLPLWYEQVKASTTPKIQFDSFQESDKTGFIIGIRLEPRSVPTKYWNVELNSRWGENPYLLSTNKSIDHFTAENYANTGTVGYLQEQNIKEIMGNFFTPNMELFASPRLKSGLELTDIAIGIEDYLVLLESKTTASFDGHATNIKSKERALTALINKASKQLINAEQIVLNNHLEIYDTSLRENCARTKHVVKVCVVNDITLINKKSLAESLGQYHPNDLPIIMSLSTLYDILFTLQSQYKIVQTLHEIKLYLQKEAGLPILAGIKP